MYLYLKVGFKVTKKVDVGSAIFNAVKDTNRQASNHALVEGCRALGVMRGDITNVSYLDASLASEDGYNTLLKYYRAWSALASKLPRGINLQSDFTWYDAFDRESSCAQRDPHFERMSVLYNIAVCRASLATSVSHGDTIDDVKRSVRLFQSAAGFFDQIIQSPLRGSVTLDMHQEALVIVKTAMLANAQAAFYDIASRTRKSHSILGRLAAGVRDLCQEISRRCLAEGFAGSQLCDQIGRPAGALALYYDAEAHSQRALVCSEEHVMNERLTRLSTSLSLVATCRTKAHELPKTADASGFRHGLLAKLEALEKDLRARQQEAEKENNSFHFVAPLEAVSPVLGHLSAKATDISSCLETQDDDDIVATIASAIPPGIKGAAARYADAAFELINRETRQLNDAAAKLKDKITEAEATLSASASFIADGSSGSLASTTNEASFARGMDALQTLKKEGGLVGLRGKEQMVRTESVNSRKLVESIQNALAAEEAEDDRMRHESHGRLARLPSRQLNARYRSKINQILKALEDAARADSFVSNMIAEHASAIDTAFKCNTDDYSTGASGGVQDVTSQREALRQHIAAAKRLLEENHDLVQRFDKAGAQDPVQMTGGIEANANYSTQEEEEACEVALKREYDSLKEESLGVRDRTDQIHGTIMGALKAYSHSFSRDASSRVAKTEWFAQFPAALKYEEILGYISQGSDYYRKEQEVIQQLKKEVDDFVLSRRRDLATDFARLNLSGPRPTTYGDYGQYSAPTTTNTSGSYNHFPGPFPPQR